MQEDMPQIVEKVTAFVTRSTSSGRELLLFEHPFAGIQIPAGAVEDLETPDAAVIREASEETGLTGLTVSHYLGALEIRVPSGHKVIGQRTTVYARPDASSFDWAYLRRGLQVRIERESDEYTQVTFEEFDRIPEPQYVTYQITGWVSNQALASSITRHFYVLSCELPTSDHWSIQDDYHSFDLFWAPLTSLPSVVSPQDEWLDMLSRHFRVSTGGK